MDLTDWLAQFDEHHEGPYAPAPLDALSDEIREAGELEELPALCLLDEIARLRTDLASMKALLIDIGHEILGCDGSPCRVESLAFGIDDIRSALGDK